MSIALVETTDPKEQIQHETFRLIQEGLLDLPILDSSKAEKTIRRLLTRIALKREFSRVELLKAKRIVQIAPVLAAKACRTDQILLDVYEQLGAFRPKSWDAFISAH